MNILLNLLCKSFITFLDIWLFDFFIKYSFSNIYNYKKKIILIYIIIFICFLLSTTIILKTIIYLISSLFFILWFYRIKIPLVFSTKKFIQFFIIRISLYIFINILFSLLFNTIIMLDYIYHSTPYILLTQCIYEYSTYIIFIFVLKLNNHLDLLKFKVLSIVIFLFFCLNVILDNPAFFRSVSIARTYIFTVVISIVALICFDRMQAKYEAEKYSQEAIIQNMKKEKSFNEQRAKRQEEIKKINHNLVNILAITQSHISDQEYEKAQDYLSKTIQSVVEEYNALNHSGIDSLDGIIQEKMSIMKENGIRYDEEISKLLHFGNIDLDNLVLIIDLALDKAIEEVQQISGEKYIRLTLQSKQTHIILHISHPIDKQHSRFHAHNQSSHHDLAFKQIETITKRYHGDIKYDTTDNEVILRVILEK